MRSFRGGRLAVGLLEQTSSGTSLHEANLLPTSVFDPQHTAVEIRSVRTAAVRIQQYRGAQNFSFHTPDTRSNVKTYRANLLVFFSAEFGTTRKRPAKTAVRSEELTPI